MKQMIVLIAVLMGSFSTAFGNQCATVHSLKTTAQLLRNYSASETISQKFRDNAPHYWSFVRQQLPSMTSQAFSYTGIVHGDAHAGNFIVAPIGNKMKYYAFDIKDGGYGSFLFDFNRLVLNAQAVLKDNRQDKQDPRLPDMVAQRLLHFYLAGLMGQAMETPEYMNKALEYSVEKYNRKLIKDGMDDVKKEKPRFKKSKDSLTPLEKSDQRYDFVQKSLKRLFPQFELFDVAEKVKERGGSKEHQRLWALVSKNHGEDLEVLEFKQIEEASTAQFMAQPSVEKRYELIEKYIVGFKNPEQALARTEDGTYYMVRKRKYELFSFPYKLKSLDDIQDFNKMLAVTAHFLGQLHGAQMTRQQIQTIQNDQTQILKDMSRINKAYLKTMKDLLSAPTEINDQFEEIR